MAVDLLDWLSNRSLQDFQSVVSAAAHVVVAGATIWFTRRTRRLDEANRQHQKEEADARAGLALNVGVEPRLFPEGESLFVETRVTAKNPTTRTWCVPAAFIAARAFVNNQTRQAYTGQETFDDMGDCGQLSRVVNRARFPNTIIKVAPEETETFVRYDRLNRDFVDAYPVVVVRVELYGADDLLSTPAYRPLWLKFIERKEKEGCDYDFFSRFGFDGDPPLPGFKRGDRYIRTRDGEGKFPPDVEACEQFRWFLTTPSAIVTWTQFVTVNLRKVCDVSVA